jgi:glucose-1-phosphate thymidylyltransferase
LLGKLGGDGHGFKGSDVKIVEPVLIHESAEISNSVIGPFVSIGANCKITNSQITESIVESDCEISNAALDHSLIGRHALVTGRGDGHVANLNVGDDSSVVM